MDFVSNTLLGISPEFLYSKYVYCSPNLLSVCRWHGSRTPDLGKRIPPLASPWIVMLAQPVWWLGRGKFTPLSTFSGAVCWFIIIGVHVQTFSLLYSPTLFVRRGVVLSSRRLIEGTISPEGRAGSAIPTRMGKIIEAFWWNQGLQQSLFKSNIVSR